MEQTVRLINGYPQFQLNGQPFFAHSAAFFYNRIPRAEWGASLAKLKSMGVNTIDLYIAWNWHEPIEGKLDFDGGSNPRRDVKGLLAMIDEMGFAVIARPGPVILNEWKNGGYPDWLLARPEYNMNEAARLDGHYPPLSGLSPVNSEEASAQWMANETHLKYTRKWFGDVMRELLKDRQAENGGRLIAIQLDDDQAINRANYNGPIFWKYMNTLAGYLREAGATAPLYLNPTDMRVSAAGASHDIGVMGQWYFNFGNDPALRWEDSATLQFYVETLKTQPHFPPMIIEYQAGWYGTGDDAYAKSADPTNTLLSSRLMISHGLRGLNYFPAQDTLYPAGYEVPWSNHYYTWESALTLDRNERPRASAIHRNGRLTAGLGRELAATRKAADIGLIYPISSFDQAALTRDEIMRVSRSQLQIQQFCQLNQVAVEYIDLEFHPVESLKRHKTLLLPVFDVETGGQRDRGTEGQRDIRTEGPQSIEKFRLSAQAQRKLVDYVNAGGILVCTPSAPQIKELSGNERVVVVTDFWRAIPIEPGQAKRDEVITAVQNSTVEFVSRLARLGLNRRIKARVAMEGDNQSAPPTVGASSVGATIEPNFVATQLISDESERGHGFLNVVNFDDRRAMRINLNLASPNAADGRLELPEFRLRPRDSMVLPLRLPLRAGGKEEIVYATAELLKYEMANGKIRMRFYAPDPADVALRLPHSPEGAVTVDGVIIGSGYEKRTFAFKLVAQKRGPKAKEEDELADRREHEHDVEIVYEKNLPELNIKTARLLIGENNSVAVAVANRSAQSLKGKLTLTASRCFKSQQQSLDVDLRPHESGEFNFSVPLSAKAVAGDQAVLQAALVGDSVEKTFYAPSVTTEISPRFEWRVFPKSAWPLRADSQASIHPPLIYPSDENATTANFNLKVGNNAAEEITINRKSMSLDSPPLKLKPGEEYLATYSYNFVPGTKSVIHPFTVTISDGKTTETARVNFVALRKGEAVAFAYDIDGDGFDDYVMENDYLRLIISPNAGARAFALINKRTGVNVFTSVGGLRDKFTELDPSDPIRNSRRKRGMYGPFNRPYQAGIREGMGKRVILSLGYGAPDVYAAWPGAGSIERIVTLNAGDEHFTVDYRVTPKTTDGKQAFWSSNSIAVGDRVAVGDTVAVSEPVVKTRRFVAADGAFDFAAMKTRVLTVPSGWVAAQISEAETFGVIWRSDEVKTADVEMKEYSSFINLKFKPFGHAGAHNYRLAFYLGVLKPERLGAERARIVGE
ncbi:MAG TPA: beta-galactosidase [Blastocatellia bacterium]|nr:beta-galactosidase [Blastocatellia bacterium]